MLRQNNIKWIAFSSPCLRCGNKILCDTIFVKAQQANIHFCHLARGDKISANVHHRKSIIHSFFFKRTSYFGSWTQTWLYLNQMLGAYCSTVFMYVPCACAVHLFCCDAIYECRKANSSAIKRRVENEFSPLYHWFFFRFFFSKPSYKRWHFAMHRTWRHQRLENCSDFDRELYEQVVFIYLNQFIESFFYQTIF